MAVIYLKHPKYGTKVASLDAEAAYDKENGWEEFDPVLDVAEAEDVEDEEPAPINSFEPPKRRGRPPRQETAS